MTPTPAHPSRWPKRLAPLLALATLAIVWWLLGHLSRSDPWYRNTDMNMHNLVDALSINSGVSPYGIDQPALTSKSLLALHYRAQHRLGGLPVWNVETFAASPDPLRELPGLIHAGRAHSRLVVLAVLLAAGALVYAVTGELVTASLAVVLLGGSTGLLFHGMLTRPELLCVACGNLGALFCAWQAMATGRRARKLAWLFAGGVFGALAALAKLPGVCYLGVAYGWCWLAALSDAREKPPGRRDPGPFVPGDGLLPVGGAVAVLGLLSLLGQEYYDFDPVTVQRLRLAAAGVALVPLLLFTPGRHRSWRFLVERAHEGACLGAGALTAFPLAWLALASVMGAGGARDYAGSSLHVLVNPGAYLPAILGQPPPFAHEVVRFLRETPFLFLGATVAVAAAVSLRGIPLRLKAFILLLVATGAGFVLLLSRRYYTPHYSIFPEIPLLLAGVIATSALLSAWRLRRPESPGRPWVAALLTAGCVGFLLTGSARLKPKYLVYQDDASLPVSEFTLTFMFDHDAHTRPYLAVMKQHYGTREDFARALARYLDDPAHRY